MCDINFNRPFWNLLETGRYHTPHLRTSERPEWLIVRRSGVDGQFLELSDAGPAPDTCAKPPKDLTPRNSIVGVFAGEDDQGVNFILTRTLPPQAQTMGTYFPADGFARLNFMKETVLLTAVGRHFHSRVIVKDQMVLEDVPHPSPDEAGGLTWAFDAISADIPIHKTKGPTP